MYYIGLESGKPVERQGRKAMGLKLIEISQDCQAAESLLAYLKRNSEKVL